MKHHYGVRDGLAAGAAGTTALNAVTYLDMALRARPQSSTPEQTVATLTERLHVPVPGDDEERANRLGGLGAMLGTAAGLATGAATGWAYARVRPSRTVTFAATTMAVLLAGNAPMTLLGITDPRKWSAADWISDIVPHVAYAAVATAVLTSLDPARQ